MEEKYINKMMELYDKIDELQDKLMSEIKESTMFKRRWIEANDLLNGYRCIIENGYCVLQYTTTDCDNRTQEGYVKVRRCQDLEATINGLYENAEGSTGHDIVTKNLEEYTEDKYSTSYEDGTKIKKTMGS